MSIPLPATFPTPQEELLLELVLCPDAEFATLFAQWCKKIAFDDLDYALVRLLPLVSLRLRRTTIDTPLVQRIHGVYKKAWVHNQLTVAAVKKVLPHFEQAGIPVVTLKGLPLLYAAYKDTGARFVGDADMIIHPRHAQAAMEIMRQQGFDYIKPSYRRAAPRAQELAQMSFTDPQARQEIDIHFSLFEPEVYARTVALFLGRELAHAMSYNALFPHVQSYMLGDTKSLMLGPEDMLIHVVVHGARHNKHRPVRWVADAAAIIRSLPVQWDMLVERAVLFGFLPEVRTALTYLSERFGVPIPRETVEQLSSLPISHTEMAHYYERAQWEVPRLRTLALIRYRYRGRPLSLAGFALSKLMRLVAKKTVYAR